MMRNPAYGDYVFCATGYAEAQATYANQESMETLTRFHIDAQQPT